MNRFVVVIYLVPVCKVCFRAAQPSIPERCTFRLEPVAMECPFLQVQLLIIAIEIVEQECSQSIAKGRGKGLPSAFCPLSVFIEEHGEQSFLFAPFESTKRTAPLHKISAQSVHIEALWIIESVSLLVNTKFTNAT